MRMNPRRAITPASIVKASRIAEKTYSTF
jgi:hypothetical protein